MLDFIYLLSVFMLPFSVFGLVVLSQVLRKPPTPVDASNVFNRFRLLWFAITRQNLFVDLFPWLKNDELENFENKH